MESITFLHVMSLMIIAVSMVAYVILYVKVNRIMDIRVGLLARLAMILSAAFAGVGFIYYAVAYSTVPMVSGVAGILWLGRLLIDIPEASRQAEVVRAIFGYR